MSNNAELKQKLGMWLAAILLGFYVATWTIVALTVIAQINYFGTYLSEGLFTIAELSSGIASALAVAVLGATPPGEAVGFFQFNSPEKVKKMTHDDVKGDVRLTTIYLTCWLIIGVTAVIFGVINEPTISDGADPKNLIIRASAVLGNYGNIWFGMALSAVFVFFGINRTSS